VFCLPNSYELIKKRYNDSKIEAIKKMPADVLVTFFSFENVSHLKIKQLCFLLQVIYVNTYGVWLFEVGGKNCFINFSLQSIKKILKEKKQNSESVPMSIKMDPVKMSVIEKVYLEYGKLNEVTLQKVILNIKKKIGEMKIENIKRYYSNK